MRPHDVNRRDFMRTTATSGVGLALTGISPLLDGAVEKVEAKIPVAVITQADGAHLGLYFQSLAQAPEVGAVALGDASGQNVESARRHLGAKLKAVHTDVGAMLREFKPTMALVSMEAKAAPPGIEAALDAGCHVLAEKPSCVRAEDFESLVRKAEEKKRHLMLALANRLRPSAQDARRIVGSGRIGKIYAVEAHIIADQTRLTRESYRNKWYSMKARAGGGHLIWLGIHWLDLVLYITGLSVEQVAGFAGVVGGQEIDIEDSAAVTLKFSGGTFGTMTSGYYLDKGYHSHIKIWGSHGWLQFAAVEGTPLEWYSTKDGENSKVQRVEYPDRFPGYAPLVRACVRASAGLEDPPITGPECLHVLETIFAFYKAAETGRTQKVSG